MQRLIVKATDEEIIWAQILASERSRYKSSLKVSSARLDPKHDDDAITTQGYLAEILFCRIFGAHLNIDLFPGKDDGVDVNWKGMSFQIKSSFKSDADLTLRYSHQVKVNEPLSAEHFILVRPVSGKTNCFELLWIPKDVAMVCFEKKNMIGGISELVPAKFMRSAARLLDIYP